MVPQSTPLDTVGARAPVAQAALFLVTAVFVAGLLLRIAILWNTRELGTPIMDEQQYSQIARNIVAGNGFGWSAGEPTSIRPPLYPALLAGTWSIFGRDSLQAIRIIQICLSFATAGLVYFIGASVFNRRAGLVAAAVCWLYPSFVFYDYLILTETLFTFLLVAFVACAIRLVQSPHPVVAIACGLSLGLAALTRSVLWPLPLLLCPMLVLLVHVSAIRRIALAALVLVGYALVIGPWAVRNTRLQHVVTIVDTMGGLNLRMGNYEYTPDDRMWDAVALEGEKSWVHGLSNDFHGEPITEGQKDKWAQRKAIEFMRTHPGETLRRSLIKFADFWGLEREYMAGVQKGFYDAPAWFQIGGSTAIIVGYVIVTLVGAAGIWLAAPNDKRLHVLLLLPIVVIVGAHTIVFGHSRYHLPLVPIFAVYAAALVSMGHPSFRRLNRPLVAGAVMTITVLLSVWVRQVAITDLDRILALLNHAG
jgi:4-amino-4-deoxy-L-arabinose transferase-like glycosyltransferase